LFSFKYVVPSRLHSVYF